MRRRLRQRAVPARAGRGQHRAGPQREVVAADQVDRPPEHVGGGLQPQLVVLDAARQEDLVHRDPAVGEGVDDLAGAVRDAFHRRPVDLLGRAGQGQAEHCAAQVRVAQRRAVAHEVVQDDQPVLHRRQLRRRLDQPADLRARPADEPLARPRQDGARAHLAALDEPAARAQRVRVRPPHGGGEDRLGDLRDEGVGRAAHDRHLPFVPAADGQQ